MKLLHWLFGRKKKKDVEAQRQEWISKLNQTHYGKIRSMDSYAGKKSEYIPPTQDDSNDLLNPLNPVSPFSPIGPLSIWNQGNHESVNGNDHCVTPSTDNDYTPPASSSDSTSSYDSGSSSGSDSTSND